MNRTAESDLPRTPALDESGSPRSHAPVASEISQKKDTIRDCHPQTSDFIEFGRVPRLTVSIIKPVRGLWNDYEKRLPPNTT